MVNDIGLVLMFAVIGGAVAGLIADTRGLRFGTYFVVGVLLPILGIVLALLMPPDQRTPVRSDRPVDGPPRRAANRTP